MKAIVERLLTEAFRSLQKSGRLAADVAVEIKVTRTKNATQGDYASHLPFMLAKTCPQSARKIATLLVQEIPADSAIDKVETAAGGIINFFMSTQAHTQIIAELFEKAQNLGLSTFGQNQVSADNPLGAIQYAHARTCSVLGQLKERGLLCDKSYGLKHLDLLKQVHETQLISLISYYPEIVELTVVRRESQQMAYYLREVAKGLHSYYNAVSLVCEQENLRCARLCLLEAVRQVLNNGLNLLGVSASESM